MQFLEITNTINLLPETFRPFEGGLFLYDKEFLNTEETEPTAIVEDSFNYSFDGTFLFLKDIEKGKKLLNHIKNYLKNYVSTVEDNYDIEDDGFFNAFFYKELQSGFLILDAKTDFGSLIDEILEDFEYKDDIEEYSDSHLCDHIYLGRTDEQYDKFYKFLFDQNVINASFVLVHNEINFINKTDIVITGDFYLEFDILDHMKNNIILNNSEVKDSPENSTDWIWCGNNPDPLIIENAKKHNCKISDINEVVEILYSSFDSNDESINVLKI